MASSGNLRSTDLPEVVATQLRSTLGPSPRVLLGLSGGVDSVVLLHILCLLRDTLSLKLHAMYVDHGISHNASYWGQFCSGLCDAAGVPFSIAKVDLASNRHLGIEGAARLARYEALGRYDSDAILVGHHQDDQAETFLLQLMRGSGVKGLASMPVSRPLDRGAGLLIRPFLHVPRKVITSYAKTMQLKWIEDESNNDVRYKRNYLRLQVMPVLEKAFPGAKASISASATHLFQAGRLLDDIADTDLRTITQEGGLNVAGLVLLGQARSANAFRRWCELEHLEVPGKSQLAETLRQLSISRPDAQTKVVLTGVSLRLWRGMLHRISDAGRAPFTLAWHGEAVLKLPDRRGSVYFMQAEGRGVHASLIGTTPLILRSRSGGETIQPDCSRPRRTLKNLFQEKCIPPWQREQVPLVWCGPTLVSIPGIGTDCHWQAPQGQAGWVIDWRPAG